MFIGRTDAKAETPILWPPHVKSWLIGKVPDAGRDWGQEEKGTIENEMAGWHHWVDGHEVWVNSRSWWWTGRPGVLRFTGSQRVGHDWATEMNWTELNWMDSNNIQIPPNRATQMQFISLPLGNWVPMFCLQSQFHPSYSLKQETSRKQWELKLQLECPYIQILAALLIKCLILGKPVF